MSTAAHSSDRCVQTSSTVTRLSALPIVQAKPALVEASALKSICASAFADPTSKGLGIAKQPRSCSLRNVARLSANEIGIGVSPFRCFLVVPACRETIPVQRAAPANATSLYLFDLFKHDLRANACVCREGKPAPTFPDHACSCLHLTQERAFLGENELVFLGKCEILHPLSVGTELGAIFLVGREACE